jgi:hypothetical protein
MKLFRRTKKLPPGLMAALLMVAAAANVGAATALNGRIDIRPLSPSDIKDYGLTGAQGASGLNTVAIGEPVYLDAEVNLAIPAANITNVTWTLTSRPPGSTAALTDSPLGANVPVYKPADQLVYQIAGRAMLRLDLRGQYVVTAAIGTTTSGTTNVSVTINGGTWMGVQTCELCHSGSLLAPDKYELWTNTLHASKFTRGINGQIAGYGAGCISCHTVGYDVNTNAVNGGFDDIAKQLGWVFPTVLTNSNWASMQASYPSLANLANIQCENCHGPGSEHAYSLGDTNKISVSWSAGNCGQCHDAKSHHVKVPEWKNSKHAITTTHPSGPGQGACVRCHTAIGFANYTGTGQLICSNTTYEEIGCTACHEPHDAANPHQLRTSPNVLLADGVTTVTNGGLGGFCMNCHRSRNGSVTNSIVNYPLLQPTWAGGSGFGPHDNPASDMLEGVNGWTYGKAIPSSAHALSVSNTCVGCHMQPVASTDPAFLQAGGHTFSMTYTNTSGVTVDKVDVCVQCHGQISSFDMVKVDYNGDGIIEGVQTEVQHLLDQLSTMLPPGTYRADGNYSADGLVKTLSYTWSKTNMPAKFLKAGYNWQFVNNDKSKGVHNAAYAVGLLKASIADLSGTSVVGGLPDWWATLYFGSPTNSLAAPNACPSNDGVPNWLKYALGLNPWVAGQTLTNGVVYGNVTAIGGETNTVHIYTAAEVSFDTEVGKTYQIQGVSSLSGGWQNVGSAVAGTGSSVSLLTPTRNNVQQYFRVVHTP